MNKKGFSIIELVLSFSLLAIVLTGLISYSLTYGTRSEVESIKNNIVDFKNAVTKTINDDIINLGLTKIENATNYTYYNDIKTNTLYHYANSNSYSGIYYTTLKTGKNDNGEDIINTKLNGFVLSNSKGEKRDLVIKIVDDNGEIASKGIYIIYGKNCTASDDFKTCISFKVPESDVSRNYFVSQILSTTRFENNISSSGSKAYGVEIKFAYLGVGLKEPYEYVIRFNTMS